MNAPTFQLDASHTLLCAKLNELTKVLFLRENDESNNQSCGCCGQLFPATTLSCVILSDEADEWLIAWACHDCYPQIKLTVGGNIKQVAPITMKEIEATLLASEWLDSEILRQREGEPFIRRPTYAETIHPDSGRTYIRPGAAVVVTQPDDKHLCRRLLPMPFPWHDDSEWIIGEMVAREALAMADAIERGDADLTVFQGGFSIASMDNVTYAEILRAGDCYD